MAAVHSGSVRQGVTALPYYQTHGSARAVQARVISSCSAPSSNETFFSAGSSFKDLGLSEKLVDAVNKAGFNVPAQIQSIAIPSLLTGSDVAVASETGSGKTLAYLLPLLDSLKWRQEYLREHRPNAPPWFQHSALILCPNVELCEQIVATAHAVAAPRADGGTTTARVITNRCPPPLREPTDVIVSTPAALCRFLDEAGGAYGPQWNPENFSQSIRHLVCDEADALVTSDSFFKPLTRILDLMRKTDREFVARAVAAATSTTVEDFDAAKRLQKLAAFRGGLPAMVEAGWCPEAGHIPRAADGSLAGTASGVPEDLWVGKPHRCRSYVFVGATFPREGGKSVAGDLRKRYPDMLWLEGPQLHASKSGVVHEWVPVASGARSETVAAVVTALRAELAPGGVLHGSTGEASGNNALVFCRDTAAARVMHEELENLGMESVLYHKKLPPSQRQEALRSMHADSARVLVCTDAASRGLDFPSVALVVQADFADNAVDFLHRIGRTARAHRNGKAVSCYSEERRDLALAIKASIEEGVPVEGAFSRNRSFSGKMKKHGRFIPRGMTA